MRRIVMSLVIVLAVAATLSAQTTAVRFEQIMISHGKLNFILTANQDAFYLGEPAVSIPAEARPGATLRLSSFTVRGWREGDHMRVVVYAVVPQPQAPSKTIETAMATYAIKFASSGAVVVPETAEWGAAPMVLRTVRPLRR